MAYHKLIPPRNTAAVLDSKRLSANEIALDTTNKEIRIFDGVTLGGIKLARKDLVEDLISEIATLTRAISDLTDTMNTYYTGRKPAYMTTEESNTGGS